MRAAVFFDRDGTLNEEVGYAGRPEDLHVFPFAAEAVRRVNASGRAAVLLTNQAGVARGFFGEAEVRYLHDLLGRQLAEGGARLDGVYYCPHHPQGTVPEYTRVCDCRKPGSGMIRQAARDLALDLPASWMIGDRYHDIGTAHAVGARGVLVMSGYGAKELETPPARAERPDYTAANVLDAVERVLQIPREPRL